MGQNLSIPDEIKLPVKYFTDGMNVLLNGVGSKEFNEFVFSGVASSNPVMTIEQYNYYYTYVQKMAENIHKNGAAISAFLQATAVARTANTANIAGGVATKDVQVMAGNTVITKPATTKTI